MRDYLWCMSLLEWLKCWSKSYSLPLFCHRIPAPNVNPVCSLCKIGKKETNSEWHKKEKEGQRKRKQKGRKNEAIEIKKERQRKRIQKGRKNGAIEIKKETENYQRKQTEKKEKKRTTMSMEKKTRKNQLRNNDWKIFAFCHLPTSLLTNTKSCISMATRVRGHRGRSQCSNEVTQTCTHNIHHHSN